MHDQTTIIAQATPPGRGGVAIIRISGPLVVSIIPKLIKKNLPPRLATYAHFYFADELIDAGLAIFFPQPNSFTGEDVLELHCHGGVVVVDSLLQSLLALGATLAQPGEFSLRAFLNGKMDLTQAEAVADLIDASSKQAARLALRSLQGEFAKAVNIIIEKIIYLRMYIEAAIDFVDEEIDFLADDKIYQRIVAVIQDLQDIQSKAQAGSRLREGLTAVIVGAPNVGKSSLLNRLSAQDVAIVTDIPGTTRDVLRHQILIDDIPLQIIDTAGLRESEDKVEQEGIRRAQKEMQQADLLLHVIDNENALPSEHFSKSDARKIIIRNKIDLQNLSPAIQEKENAVTVFLSARTGCGMDLLKQSIKQTINASEQSEGLYLARRRHLDALSQANKHLQACQPQIKISSELAAEELRLTQLALQEITGEFTTDDLLGRIFASFCIGK